MDLINFIFSLGVNPNFIFIVILAGIVGYLRLERKHNEQTIKHLNEQIQSLKTSNSKLKEKYYLLDRHTLLMSHNLQLAIKKRLHKQMPGGEWSSCNPLVDD